MFQLHRVQRDEVGFAIDVEGELADVIGWPDVDIAFRVICVRASLEEKLPCARQVLAGDVGRDEHVFPVQGEIGRERLRGDFHGAFRRERSLHLGRADGQFVDGEALVFVVEGCLHRCEVNAVIIEIHVAGEVGAVAVARSLHGEAHRGEAAFTHQWFGIEARCIDLRRPGVVAALHEVGVDLRHQRKAQLHDGVRFRAVTVRFQVAGVVHFADLPFKGGLAVALVTLADR